MHRTYDKRLKLAIQHLKTSQKYFSQCLQALGIPPMVSMDVRYFKQEIDTLIDAIERTFDIPYLEKRRRNK